MNELKKLDFDNIGCVRFKGEVDCTFTKKVPMEDISNAISTALEGGISYWFNEEVDAKSMLEAFDAVSKHAEQYEGILYMSDKLLQYLIDGNKFTVLVDGEEHSITLSDIQKGFEYNFGRGRVEVEDWDADDSDIVFQVALFGEVVYG